MKSKILILVLIVIIVLCGNLWIYNKEANTIPDDSIAVEHADMSFYLPESWDGKYTLSLSSNSIYVYNTELYDIDESGLLFAFVKTENYNGEIRDDYVEIDKKGGYSYMLMTKDDASPKAPESANIKYEKMKDDIEGIASTFKVNKKIFG